MPDMNEAIFLPLHSEDDWTEFAEANRDALLDMYPDLDAAHKAACEGGIVLGGGAAPMVEVRFVD